MKRTEKMDEKLFKKAGIKLDLGCGGNKQPGFVGMDIRKCAGVDIVHDAECPPYPIPDSICHQVLMSHLIEHMCPKKIFGVMNEVWRIMKPQGQLLISSPYGGSDGFWQDPTHTHGWSQATVYYFDPYPRNMNGERCFLYDIYKPKPWKIERNDWHDNGNLEIIFTKREDDKNAK